MWTGGICAGVLWRKSLCSSPRRQDVINQQGICSVGKLRWFSCGRVGQAASVCCLVQRSSVGGKIAFVCVCPLYLSRPVLFPGGAEVCLGNPHSLIVGQLVRSVSYSSCGDQWRQESLTPFCVPSQEWSWHPVGRQGVCVSVLSHLAVLEEVLTSTHPRCCCLFGTGRVRRPVTDSVTCGGACFSI